jgi:hypothetical protein
VNCEALLYPTRYKQSEVRLVALGVQYDLYGAQRRPGELMERRGVDADRNRARAPHPTIDVSLGLGASITPRRKGSSRSADP